MIYRGFGKRTLDVLVATSAGLALLPLMLPIALAIRLHDGGPVFYRHTRVGRGGRNFQLLKFRSMRVNNDYAGEEVGTDKEKMAEMRRAFQGTPPGDARITAVGKWLRRTHLDELPQLWNVVAGDMSLIGPRPDTPVQMVDYHPATWRRRHAVRPGITGLAQVNAPRVATERIRQCFDMAYIRKLSFCLDVSLVFRTVLKVFRASSY